MSSGIEKIGIVGGGQLGRMLTVPAKQLGFEVMVVDPVENCPAAQVGAEQIQAALTDTDAIFDLAKQTDVLTWEIEHIPADYLKALHSSSHNVEPNPRTLSIIQDKLMQKKFLQSQGIPVAPFYPYIPGQAGPDSIGPFIVKTRKGGYDGRGNLVLDRLDETRIDEVFGDKPVYVEQVIDFDKELAVVAARDKRGRSAVYPVVETIHKDNICHTVIYPAKIPGKVSKDAEEIARVTLDQLEGAGVFAIEMFADDGNVMVNEIAPRVHNSGHLTIEGSVTSQFEQHIRAITGLPLGSTAMRAGAVVMVNILGTETKDNLDRTGQSEVFKLPDVNIHWYGKLPRAARKIGHITALGANQTTALSLAQSARRQLTEI